MATYQIYKIAGLGDTRCCVIDAKSEYAALRAYKKNLISSGYSWMEKVLGHWSIYTSYGAQFVAVPT